jgi:hypothetical protein
MYYPPPTPFSHLPPPDSYDWVASVGDPGFAYFVTAAQLWGLLALRIADAEAFGGTGSAFGGALPFNHTEVMAQVVPLCGRLLVCQWSTVYSTAAG